MYNLSIVLEDSAREVPNRTALAIGETELTYAQVNGAANQVANALVKRGLKPGDKVALGCPNVPQFALVYYGILKAGGVVVPLNVLLKGREIAYHLGDSDAVFYFCFEGTADLPMATNGKEGFDLAEKAREMVVIPARPTGASPIDGVTTLGEFVADQSAEFDSIGRGPNDTAVILYTSGTTGQPKGAELSHSNMLLNARLSDNMFERRDHDVHLIVLPLFHSFGQTVQMNAGFYNRATLVLLPRFDPEATLATMAARGVTIFAGVPTMYWALLNHPGAENHDLKGIAAKLRIALAGGAASPVEVLKAFEEKFGVRILEGYGLSETSPVASFNRTDRESRPGSVGLPVWGCQIEVRNKDGARAPVGEPGEICIKGHNIMKGYYNKPEETAKAITDGWLRTGDIGQFDEDGYLYITDRVKDMIIRGGYNVYPRELEEVLVTHPAISLAAVVGVAHERHGEEVKAFVILKAGAEAKPEEIVSWSKENMADYKYPRMVEIRESLPMTATGKILKRELR